MKGDLKKTYAACQLAVEIQKYYQNWLKKFKVWMTRGVTVTLTIKKYKRGLGI